MDIENLNQTAVLPKIEDTTILQVSFSIDWYNRWHDRTVLWAQPDLRCRVYLLVDLQTYRPIACALTKSSRDRLID